MALSNLPPGVNGSEDYFYPADWPETCPGCGQEAADEPYCPLCGYVLDPVEAAAIAREKAEDAAYDLAREMEME